MQQLNVKTRMWLAIAFIALSLTAIWFINRHFQQVTAASHSIRDLVGELHTEVLAMRGAEKDFLVHNDMTHVETFNRVFAEYSGHQQALMRRMQTAGMETAALERVHRLFLDYREGFVAVVEKQQEIGLTPEDGHYGRLRAAARAVEAIISDDPALMQALLSLRRHEKNFMIQRDPVFLSHFISALAPFRNLFFMSDIDYAIQADAQKALREYTARFEDLVALEKEIGLDPQSGLLGEMTTAIGQAEGAFSELRQQLDATLDSQMRRSERLSFGIVLAVMVTSVLMLAFINRGVNRSVGQAVAAARALGRGEWDTAIDTRRGDEIGVLLRALASMRDELVRKSRTLEQESRIKGRHAELAGLLRGVREEQTLCSDVVRYLTPSLDCQVGAIYLRDGDKLRFGAGYGLSGGDRVDLAPGEGLVGQVAKTLETRLVRDLPEGYCPISSGTGSAPPRQLLLVPLVWNDELYGVVELGSFGDIDEAARAFMEQAGEAIAIALNAARSRAAMARILEKTRRQADELEAQQEEKEAAYRRLAEQTERLQASEEELRVQEEELRVINEELESQTRMLHQKNREVEEKNRELRRQLEEQRMAS